jgi:cytochrome b subunit of formate dehydrogenase
MNRRTVARLASSLWALSLTFTALGLLLLVLNLSHPDVPVYSFWAENVLFSVGFSTVGAVIVPRMPPENAIGWLFCALGLLWAVIHLIGEYAIYALLAAPGSLPAGEVASWLYTWPWVLCFGLVVFLGLLFPNGRLPSDRWRWFARLSALLTLVAMVLVAFSPGPIVVGLPAIRNPLGIEALPNAYKAVQVLMLILIAVAAASLLVRRLYARGVERLQTKWFTYATAVAAGGAILKYVISEPLDLMWLGWVGQALVLIGLAGIPISMGIAITRYRLYEIDLLINRTLVYGALTVSLALVYFGGVTATQEIFQKLTGQVEQPQLAVVASTLVIAALFNPLRRRIQSFIDRRFYRSKHDARKTFEGFSAKLRDETDLEALSDDLVGVVGQTMQPAHVSLWLRPPQDLTMQSKLRESEVEDV